MFEQFPYADLQQLNLDWIIKIAKDFLDQYTSIQQIINDGMTAIDEETAAKIQELETTATNLQNALQEWYNEHSEDISEELATAIDAFSVRAGEIAAAAAASIPQDYSDLSNTVAMLEEYADVQPLLLTFQDGFINPTTLEISLVAGNHQISDVILIPANTLLYVPKISKSSSTTLVAKCDSSGTPTAVLVRGTDTAQSTGDPMVIPFIYPTYVRIAGNKTMLTYMKYYTRKYTEDMIFDESNIAEWTRFAAGSTIYADGIITDSGTDDTATWFNYTVSLPLNKGMTVEFWAGGGANACVLSQYPSVGYTLVQPLVYGNSGIIHMKYTAQDDIYIRLCSRIHPVEVGFSYVLPEELFHSWKIYNDALHNAKYSNSPLWNKKITAMGDSLIYGGGMGNGPTWLTNLGMKYQMDYVNLGIGSNTVAVQTVETSNPAMVERINTVPTDTEIFVLLGGANDKRLNVPIGNVNSTIITTFCGALNSIIDQMRVRCPKAKLLFMSTYHRYDSRNNNGFGDQDYALAMVQVCKNRGIPVFDNYNCSGIDFTNEYMAAWLDETVNRLKIEDGQIIQHEPTEHFSIEAYDWMTPIYDAYISSASATGYLKYLDTYSPEFIQAMIDNGPSVEVSGSNAYARPHGKYVRSGNKIYFKILFETLRDISGGTGDTVPVVNLPVPDSAPVFFEEGCQAFDTGSRLTYNTVWRLYGARTAGTFTIVYGMYTVS